MTEPQTEYQPTMADLRQACMDRIDTARESREEGYTEHTGPHGTVVSFETPAGLVLTRYGGRLVVECDCGELDGNDINSTTVRFEDSEEDPVEVTEVIVNDTFSGDRTVARRDYNALAAELVKYVTLLP